MQIPDEVMREGWRAYTGGVNPAELPQSWHAFIAGAEWARKEALKEAAAEVTNLIQGPPLDQYDRAIAEVVELIERKQGDD